MKLQVIKTNLVLHPSMTDGIKDRRYKSGYRVPPEPTVSVIMNFTVDNPMNRLRIGQTVMLGHWGTYLTTATDGVFQLANLTPVRTDYLKDTIMLEIPAELNVLELGFMVKMEDKQ